MAIVGQLAYGYEQGRQWGARWQVSSDGKYAWVLVRFILLWFWCILYGSQTRRW